ncbi:MAG TPA: S-4TM family putative pore-forming effector [Gemmatimonadaceae bacterium]|nr:S-4TM family putative pore-forming effector [Gemmatimonadaceae bacterium]
MTRSPAADSNDIHTLQNEPGLLEYQAAAKVLYRRAELLNRIQFGLGVLLPVLVAVANLALPGLVIGRTIDRGSFAAWGALYGIVIMLLDELVFDNWQLSWKRDAATAQEMFDTTLFRLPWRRTKVGEPLETEDVHTWASRWRRVDPSLEMVRDWYAPTVRCVPLYLARVMCQRTNLWWDSKLRQQYALLLGIFAFSLAVLAFAVSKYLGLDVDGLLLATSTVAPAFRWAVRERKRHRATASTLERLCTRARELQDRIMADTVDVASAEQQSRELQDDIFDHRRSAPIGISWLYRIRRSEFEPAMGVNADHVIREYREKRGLPPCAEIMNR